MRLRLYTRRIEIIGGKEKLYRDMASKRKIESTEHAKEIAENIIKEWREYWQENGKCKWDENWVGINFKVKDLDTKKVIEIFEIRF